MAALEALARRRHLPASTQPDPRRFSEDLARVVEVPWEIAVGADLALPGVEAPQPEDPPAQPVHGSAGRRRPGRGARHGLPARDRPC